MRVAFLHPDLGIGGAEQLVINLAMCCKTLGWFVKIYTPSYDPNRAFQQTKDGTLEVEVRGNLFPRRIFGRFHALCEYVRVLFAAIYMILFGGAYDLVIVDQIPLAIPLLKLRYNTMFYCHYPDKLLCTERGSIIKRVYRFFIDIVEEITMLFAKVIVVNSKFTQNVFRNNFKLITKFRSLPSVIYPSIDLKDYDSFEVRKEDLTKVRGLESLSCKNINELKIVVSLNRYENKKNLPLAVESFINYMDYLNIRNPDERKKHVLIIAGGYDETLNENIEVYQRLKAYDFQDFSDNIFFLRNISNNERSIILRTANIVIYTPKNEHFGIVPVESMYCGAFVLAHKSGGPIESIVDGKTGYLIENEDPKEWARKLSEFFYPWEGDVNVDAFTNMNTKLLRNTLKDHVIANFSLKTMINDIKNVFTYGLKMKIN
jgi:alpha-1,3/alpha-1,6-mannosyltransferase